MWKTRELMHSEKSKSDEECSEIVFVFSKCSFSGRIHTQDKKLEVSGRLKRCKDTSFSLSPLVDGTRFHREKGMEGQV